MDDAYIAAQLMAVDPAGIGGIFVRGRHTGALDTWLSACERFFAALGPVRRVPVSITEGRLLGGLDLAATLARGAPVVERGLLAEADRGLLLIPNVECARALTLSAVCSALDAGETVLERDGLARRFSAAFSVIALDETCQAAVPALSDRLGIMLVVDPAAARARTSAALINAEAVSAARARLGSVAICDAMLDAICGSAAAFGADSMRTTLQAVSVARAHAALSNRPQVSEADAEAALRLVIIPRATRLPAELDEETPEDEPPPPDTADHEDAAQQEQTPQDAEDIKDMLIAAALARLPDHLLDALKAGSRAAPSAKGIGRAGEKQKARTHGRRARARRGDPKDGAPLDILETLRAAAPWQRLRRAERARGPESSRAAPCVEVRRQDFRVRTFKNHRETATIFVVDASGSAALHRMAEAKGAIELLLADCYARRDHVALVAFRGTQADLLLPPTRSLARVKRSLAGLPGGGGTPLAAAAAVALELADAARRKGQSVTIVFLTDGKANIDRAGAGSRPRAEADALQAARAIKMAQHSALVVDTSPRPGAQSKAFAAEMAATYLPLPHANAKVLSDAVRARSAAAP